MATYSFGEDSPLKFEISDKQARYYNEAAEEWFKAQQRFNQKFGRRWDPHKDPIGIRWNRKQQRAWNDFAKIYRKVLNDYGPYHENDLMDDFLVKNPAHKVGNRSSTGIGAVLGGLAQLEFKPSERWEYAVTLAVAGGVLYGLLRGPQRHV